MEILNDPYEIAKYIKNVEKKTPVKVYLKGEIKNTNENIKIFGDNNLTIIIGDYKDVEILINENKATIEYYHLENDRKNSAIPMLDKLNIKARIEPGAIIRDMVTIKENAVIMMGAVINIGSQVGKNTMIDMNAVLGARATVGDNVHVGAGTVIAGVLEPPSKTPVIVEDDVLIGANCVILEGVRLKKGCVIAAGSVVTEDVEENQVVAGSPAKLIKMKDQKTIEKTEILDDLRG
ncbi:2,3,4,5-tetrahydropyridine-2,6-dicarboxylate N-acetyltransferase [Peptostreptococcaceae bacterium AGR-M142]